MTRKKDLGDRGERAAVAFLKKAGYRILQRNYACKSGEIDIVALDRGEIVFVEVRTRSAETAPSPAESVTAKKVRRIVRAATDYAHRKKVLDRPMRFDVVSIILPDDGPPELEVFRDAFAAPPFTRTRRMGSDRF